jgi:hypothetical protein
MAELVLNAKTSLASFATPEGRDFVADCVRAGEGLISDRELRDKYEIAPDAWKVITKNKSLIQAIRAESERRVRTGLAAQEAAAKHFSRAPKVLNDIMSDKATHPKFRIEASKELRSTAIGNGNGAAGAGGQQFVININLTGKTERHAYDLPLKQVSSTKDTWGWDEASHE